MREWFSKYSFEAKHTAGKKNILANFLTRPKEFAAIISINMYVGRNPRGSFKAQEINPKWPSYSYPPEIFRLI